MTPQGPASRRPQTGGGRGGGATAERARLDRQPSALGLTRLSAWPLFPLPGDALYRHVARLVELGADQEFLIAPCGGGATVQIFARVSGAGGAGVDPSREYVEAASAAAKAEGMAGRLHFEEAGLQDLPYQDDVFDLAIGELGLAAEDDPAAAVRELVRVTRPLGTVALVQLVWTGSIDTPRRQVLVDHLGARPLLLMEWKQLLRDAGVVDLAVEDWSEASGWLRAASGLRGLALLVPLRERLRLLVRAWRRWGWRGIRATWLRELELRELITRERVLGVSLIRGRKWQPNGTTPS